MNEIIRALCARKSVRVFEPREIGAEEKHAILRAAMEAPTAGNQQLYTILDITDQELKNRLAESCDHQPFIATAPLVLIFCADVQKWYDVFAAAGATPRKPGTGDLLLACADALIAAQNAVTAAESFGIGSCYIGDILEQCELHREMLCLPDYVMPAAMLVFGYPAPSQIRREKPQRCRLEDIVCENGYVRKDAAQLKAMFEKECRTRSFEEWAQAFCARKYNSEFSREMTRSADVYLDAFRGEYDA